METYKAEITDITNHGKDKPRFTEDNVLFNGFEWKIPDFASFCAQLHEIFLDEVYGFKSSSNNPIIIDCGSNVGVSIAYFKTIYPQSQIIGFEADPNIFSYLENNTKQFQNIELYNKAVWTENKQIQFFCQGADGGSIVNEFDNTCTTEAIRLKDVLSKYNRVDFLKIDIEGAETEVLKDCREELRKVENIFIEYHSIKKHPQNLDIILSILSENGFRYYLEGLSKGQKSPLITPFENVGMDLQVSIWGKRNR